MPRVAPGLPGSKALKKAVAAAGIGAQLWTAAGRRDRMFPSRHRGEVQLSGGDVGRADPGEG